MRRRHRLLVLFSLLAIFSLGVGLAIWQRWPRLTPDPGRKPAAAPPAADSEADFRRALLTRDSKALLRYFQGRVPDHRERRELESLLAQLGDDSFRIRQSASLELLARGDRAVWFLRAQRRHPDPEVAGRIARCLQERPDLLAEQVAAIDLLFTQVPDQAGEVLLAYAPFAEDDTLRDRIAAGLAQRVPHDEKLRTALAGTLADGEPLRRAVAARALIKSGDGKSREATLRLLHDADARVRSQVGRALLAVRDPRGIPGLISALHELDEAQTWPVVDLLGELAGEEAPALPLTDRKALQIAWQEWWRRSEPRLEAANPTFRWPEPEAGATLIARLDLSTLKGQVAEIVVSGLTPLPRRDYRITWRVNDLRYPLSVSYLSAERFLVAEMRADRVSEQSVAGEIVWEKEVPGPIFAQRLPEGQTFIVCRDRLLIVDARGQEVFRQSRARPDLVAARRGPNGTIAALTSEGECLWLDREGKETGRFRFASAAVLGLGFDLLPGGRVLIPLVDENRVVEVDARGRELWWTGARSPVVARRLSGGRTLIVGRLPPRRLGRFAAEDRLAGDMGLLLEVDRAGKILTSLQLTPDVVHIDRR